MIPISVVRTYQNAKKTVEIACVLMVYRTPSYLMPELDTRLILLPTYLISGEWSIGHKNYANVGMIIIRG